MIMSLSAMTDEPGQTRDVTKNRVGSRRELWRVKRTQRGSCGVEWERRSSVMTGTSDTSVQTVRYAAAHLGLAFLNFSHCASDMAVLSRTPRGQQNQPQLDPLSHT